MFSYLRNKAWIYILSQKRQPVVSATGRRWTLPVAFTVRLLNAIKCLAIFEGLKCVRRNTFTRDLEATAGGVRNVHLSGWGFIFVCLFHAGSWNMFKLWRPLLVAKFPRDIRRLCSSTSLVQPPCLPMQSSPPARTLDPASFFPFPLFLADCKQSAFRFLTHTGYRNNSFSFIYISLKSDVCPRHTRLPSKSVHPCDTWLLLC